MNHALDTNEAIQNSSDSEGDAGTSDEEIDNRQSARRADEVRNVAENTEIEGEEDDGEGLDDGIVLTGYNLNEEREEGHFKAGGQYVEKKTDDDPWLDQIDQAQADEDAKPRTKKSIEDLVFGRDEKKAAFASAAYLESDDLDENKCRKIIQTILLQEQPETVQEALSRLSGNKQKKKRTNKKRKRGRAPRRAWEVSSESDDEDMSSASSSSKGGPNPEQFHKLTEAANKLVQLGDYGVYTDTYTSITKKLPQESPSEYGVRWEYKWNKKDKAVHGPFTTEEMTKWKLSGFFANPVFFRKFEESRSKEDVESGEWDTSDGVDFEMAADLFS